VSDSFLEKYKQLGKLGPAELAEIWRHYDRDNSGYIDAGPELERFLTDMLRASGEQVTELKVRDFIDGVLELFDINADGKLSRAEVEQLLSDAG
jgi:Ca2+-binding EF-hand superfamily protein